jgi:catechol 2,3-dioxygenase-like lactoylglutathione lyase family enzyme
MSILVKIGVVNEQRTNRTKELWDAPARGDQHRTVSHRGQHRAIGSLLRKGFPRSHSEPGRRQRAWVPSTREHLDDSERWGGPTPDKPTVTLSVPDPNHINSFMDFRVADIQACYELWKGRGAEFITEPIPKYGEIRCYIRDPDGYIIEVGQSTDQV